MYDRQKFVDAVEDVKKVVDELSTAGYSDLASWVDKVNVKVGDVFASRLEESLEAWVETFQEPDDDAEMDNSSKKTKKKSCEKLVQIPKISIEILLKIRRYLHHQQFQRLVLSFSMNCMITLHLAVSHHWKV